MSSYLLIESTNPFEGDDTRYFFDLAASLARAKHRVTLFLVQNGVLAAREGEHAFWFAELTQAGVEILADDVSLRERGIADERLSRAVRPAVIDVVIDCLAAGGQTLWH